MKNLLVKLFPVLTPDTAYIFLLGMFCALVLLVFLFILVGILWLIFHRSHGIPGITLETSNGTLFIASAAISDLIYSLDEHFPNLEITRVRLLKDRDALAVQVKVLYTAHGQSMLALTEDFQIKAMELLKSSFGIENISKIDLIVPKSRL